MSSSVVSDIVICVAAAAATLPLHSFTTLCWNQPASFVAAFARRRIESVFDLLHRRLRNADTFNKQTYFWLHCSVKAWGAVLAYRATTAWLGSAWWSGAAGAGADRRKPVLPGVAGRALSRLAAFAPAPLRRLLGCGDSDESATTTTAEATTTTIGAVARRALRNSVLVVAFATLSVPANVATTIYICDISGGYPTLQRAWRAFAASAISDYDRDHPAYTRGADPWIKKRKRPSLAAMMYAKLSRNEVAQRVVMPWVGYALAMTLVSGACQCGFRRMMDWQSPPTSSSVAPSSSQPEAGDANRARPPPPAPVTDSVPRRLLRSAALWLAAFAAHGAVAYAASGALSLAVRTAVRVTDYAQPYQHAGGLSSVADGGVMSVEGADVMFAVAEGATWATATAWAAVWSA